MLPFKYPYFTTCNREHLSKTSVILWKRKSIFWNYLLYALQNNPLTCIWKHNNKLQNKKHKSIKCPNFRLNKKKICFENFTHIHLLNRFLQIKVQKWKMKSFTKKVGVFQAKIKQKKQTDARQQARVSPMCQQYLCVKWLTLDALTAPATV